LVEMTSQHIQHMHKALTQMNLQIHHVISDITGLTGSEPPASTNVCELG
jgi:transposase